MVHTGRRRWLPSPSLADLAGGGRREAGGGGGGSPPPPSQIRPEGGLGGVFNLTLARDIKHLLGGWLCDLIKKIKRDRRTHKKSYEWERLC
uniref:Uncharacterized protein n=1 Tax=Oryza sativa subsp. japonica TaxID=39947 RepID=Q7XEK2_ORYSJ|nr:hypothetical protein LOC_Os10g28260 [Oryza sativa Japonica Group]